MLGGMVCVCVCARARASVCLCARVRVCVFACAPHLPLARNARRHWGIPVWHLEGVGGDECWAENFAIEALLPAPRPASPAALGLLLAAPRVLKDML